MQGHETGVLHSIKLHDWYSFYNFGYARSVRLQNRLGTDSFSQYKRLWKTRGGERCDGVWTCMPLILYGDKGSIVLTMNWWHGMMTMVYLILLSLLFPGGVRTESPDNDSGFSDNASLLSSGSSLSASGSSSGSSTTSYKNRINGLSLAGNVIRECEVSRQRAYISFTTVALVIFFL